MNLKESYECFIEKRDETFRELYKYWAYKFPTVLSIYWEYEPWWSTPIILIKNGEYKREYEIEIQKQFKAVVEDIGMEVIKTMPKQNLIELDDYR